MRRRRAGTSGPYSVGRPQREEYIDGGSPLAGLWRARPYSDVEPPHPGADPDIDADDDGVGAPATPPPPRSAAGEGGGKGEPELDYDDDLSYGMPLWARIAPLVDGVTNLMKYSDSAEKLRAILASKGVANALLIEYVVDRAVRLGFGFRYVKKDWKQFLRLVPSCTKLKQEYYCDLLRTALVAAGADKLRYPFADQPSDMGFKTLDRAGRGGDRDRDSGDPQEVYEERTPGRIPSLETKNIEGWLSLLHGKTEKLEEKAWGRIRGKRIVDPESARFSTARLQSMLRYAFDMPDSDLAMALIAAVALREAGRLADEKAGGNLLPRLESGDPGVTAGEVLSGMSQASSAILERWLSVAVSSLAFVGVLGPGGYDEAKGAMRRSLAGMAVGMLRRYFKLLAESMLGDARRGPGADPRRLADEVNGRAREAMAAMEERTGENAGRAAARAVRDALRGMREAAAGGDAALDAAADAVVAALRAAGVEDADGLADVRRAAQGTRPQRSASTAVADVVKRIVSPARHRVVTREEAEGGIEVGAEGEGPELRLPARYHAVSRALSGGL
jgi:hypothetical protein